MAECATDIHHIETNNNATATTNLFGSFHYIVHEQAKSMVAIQELQQEVGSLLLFRQAVLAALPHLQSKAFMSSSSSSAAVAAIINNPSAIKLNNAANTWTRRRHLQQQQHQQQQQYRSLHDSSASSSEHTVATTPPTATTTPTSAAAATATATQLQHHNGVADSGFSTEANSNTSPRSSRFETGVSSSSSSGGNPLDLGKLEAGILHLNNAAACKKSANHMEKELSQHLERVRSRIARLRKDEDRLMNLLSSHQPHELSHGVRASQKTDADAAAGRVALDAADAVDAVDVDVVDADDRDEVEPCDELWQLLEEIQSKGLEMKEEIETIKLVAVADAATSAGREALRGLLLSPAAEGLPGPANVRIYDEKDYLLRCLAALERDMHYLRARQLDAEEDWHKTQQRCLVASKEVEYTRKRVKETEHEMQVIRDKLAALTGDHRPTPDDVHLMTGLNGSKSAGDPVNSHLPKDGRGYAEPNVIGGHHHYNNNNHNNSSNGKCVPMTGSATANSHVTRVHVNEASNAMTSVGSPSNHNNSSSTNPKKRVSFQEGVVTVSMPAPLISGHGAGATSAATTIKYVRPSREKVAAILRLSNPVQLQRHLLRALLENEALREQLERTKTEVTSRESQWRANSQEVSEQMAVLKEENEDLRFQLEEQKIELEGTKARLRLVNRTPPPALVSVQMKTAATQTEPSHQPMLASSFHSSGIHEGTQTDSSPSSSPDNYKAARILPRVIDVSPKSKLSKLNALMDQERKGSNSWDDEDRPSVERRSYSSGGNAPVSRIPTPIKHSNLLASPALCVKTPHSAAAAAAPGKRELPDIPVSQSNNVSIVTHSHSLRSKRKDKDNLMKVSSTSTSPGKHSSTAAATSTRSPGALTTTSTKSATQSRDLNEAKVRIGRTTVNSGSPNHLGHQHSNNQQQNQGRTRLKLTESLSSSEDNNIIHDSLSSNEGAQISFKGDDYYDSINENRRASALIKSGISSGSGSSTYASPIDSLERSLPSVGINYHYRRSRDISSSHDNRSSYSSGSTTPSNSLSFHG